MSEYYTDREYGARIRDREIIDEAVWGGIQGLVETRIDDGSFGYLFPEVCLDGGTNACGTDRQNFIQGLTAEIPGLVWPWGSYDPPPTPMVLDLLEFCAKAVGKPISRGYHDYRRHPHLVWNHDDGLATFVAGVNLIFARNGVAFELTKEGRARRILPDHLGHALLQAHFRTGDALTDSLLETARNRFLAPRVEDRRDGLEKLWDAFERIKTLDGPDKRSAATSLLDRAAKSGSLFRQVLELEARALTDIGNNHLIRHFEKSQEPVETTGQVDYLFGRLFAFLHLVLASRAPEGSYR